MILVRSLALATLAAVAAVGSAVVDLHSGNFDEIVHGSEKVPTLIKFYAPWCGHCKTLAPIYEELAASFAHAKDKVKIAKVDVEAERDLGKKNDIQGFPTLKFFNGKSGKIEEHSGPRTLEGLAAFIKENAGVELKKRSEMPSEVVMLTDKSFHETVGNVTNVLVAFTAPWCGHCKTLAPVWEKVAADFSNQPEVVVAKVDAEAPNSKAVAEQEGVKSYPTIKWFAAGSKTGEPYSGGRSREDLVNFINQKAETDRTVGGGLGAVAGTVAALDALVAKFLGGDKLEDVAAEVKKTAGEYNEEAKYQYAKYYVRIFDKLSKSDNHVVKELARLEGILAKGGLAPSKRDELQSKTNILRQFAKKVAEKVDEVKEKVSEAAEDIKEKVDSKTKDIKEEL